MYQLSSPFSLVVVEGIEKGPVGLTFRIIHIQGLADPVTALHTCTVDIIKLTHEQRKKIHI